MKPEEMKKNCDLVTGMMKAVAHPQRLMMLCHLADGEKSVGELQALCEISQSQLSQFLKRMERERLLSSRKEGNFVFYSIEDKKLLKMIQSIQRIFCP